VLQLRVTCPPDITDGVVARLRDETGIGTLSVERGIGVVPEGDVVVCEVARERANVVLEQLRALGVERRGAISVLQLDAASRAGHIAEEKAPGHEADALPWVLIEEAAHDDAELSITFLVLMALASIIATVGIAIDSAVLIIGAMIVGPEYGPLVAIAVGLRRRLPLWRAAVGVLLAGIAAAVIAATLASLVAEVFGDPAFAPSSRFFTSFVTEPNAYSAVVAFVAGVAGTIALARAQATAVAGVLVSVTTIPAAAAMGVDIANSNWSDFGGASLQLAINLVALVVAGIVTLTVYDHSPIGTAKVTRRARLP
jgi:uncharacterized hydrophobic protein (TIGR00271 family)